MPFYHLCCASACSTFQHIVHYSGAFPALIQPRPPNDNIICFAEHAKSMDSVLSQSTYREQMLLHQVRRTEDSSKGISQLQPCASILQTPLSNHGFPTIWKSLHTSLKWNNSLLIVVLPAPALRLMTVAVQHIVLKKTPVSPILSNVCDGSLNEGLSNSTVTSCICFW